MEKNIEETQEGVVGVSVPSDSAITSDISSKTIQPIETHAGSSETQSNRVNSATNKQSSASIPSETVLNHDSDGRVRMYGGQSRFNPEKDLTAKERVFAETVAAGNSISEAARRAEYKDVEQATKVRRRAHVAAWIDERKKYYRSIANIEAEDIIGAQTELAFSRIQDALDEDGNFDFARAKKKNALGLIKKISTTYTKMGKTVNLEFYSRADALSQLADILGIKKEPAKNNARTRLLEALNKIMRVENMTFAQAYEYIAERQRVGEVQLFSPELMREVATERGIEVQQLGTSA